jgi:UDP-N-acetylmuramyl pentapeptide synthase
MRIEGPDSDCTPQLREVPGTRPNKDKMKRAILRRLTLRHTTFIGVTGSCGKTTTVDITKTILSQKGAVYAKSGDNYVKTTVKTVLSLT